MINLTRDYQEQIQASEAVVHSNQPIEVFNR